MKSLFLLILLFSSLSQAGVKSLTPDLEDVVTGKESLYQVSLSSAPTKEVIVLIHGIEIKHIEQEWRAALSFIRQQNKVAYFIKWSKRVSLDENVKVVLSNLKELNARYPEAELKIFAHSSGGAVAILALDKLTEEKSNVDLKLHTMASPLFGYGAPPTGLQTFIGSQFVGKSTMEIGQGIIDRLQNKELPACFHWITTNCDLDKHACKQRSGVYPQQGRKDLNELPCGEENTFYFDDETHHSIILRVLRSVLLK